MKSKKKIIIAIASVALLILLFTLAKGRKQQGIKVLAEEALVRDLTESVAASGKIYPEVEVKISSDVSGEIVEMLVVEGDTVKQGQLLCRINPELYESALSQMKASLNNAKASMATSEAQLSRAVASLRQQELNFNRQKKLYADKVISSSEFENAEAAFLMAKAEMETAQKNVLAAKYAVESSAARLEESARNYGRTSIYSPLNGVVTSLSVELGERVVGTSQMAGTEMMRISQFDFMEIRVDVNENDIIRIKKGDTAIVEVDAYKREKFKGVVSHVARSIKGQGSAAESQQAVNYEVRVRILPESYQHVETISSKNPFWPGMTGSVDIITRKESAVLTVPVSSVTMRAESVDADKVEVVFVVDNDGTCKQRKVLTGIQDGTHIQVLEGLKEGEKVITGPYGILANLLKDNMKVEVSDKESVFSVKGKK